MTTPRHLLVVGASGFVGSAVLRAAAARGLSAQAVRRDLAGLAPRAGAVVISAAGLLQGEEGALQEANAELPRRLALRCRELDLPLLHVGSAAEYGEPGGELAAEADACAPASSYGVSKLDGTRAVLGVEGLRATVARVFNVVGGWDRRTDPVSEFARALRGSPSPARLEVRDPSLVRDLAGVEWVARRLVDLAAHVGSYDVVNVCTGRGTSFGDAVRAMAAALGKEVDVVTTAPGGIPRVVGDATRLRALLHQGAEPESLQEVLRVALSTWAEITSARRG